jgi:hypothetical protein
MTLKSFFSGIVTHEWPQSELTYNIFIFSLSLVINLKNFFEFNDVKIFF